MKKLISIMTVALCLAFSFNANAQYEPYRWHSQSKEKDELLGSEQSTAYYYIADDNMFLYTENGFGISLGEGIFDYNTDYSGSIVKKTTQVIVGVYSGSTLTDKRVYSFSVGQGGDVANLIGASKDELISFIEGPGKIRFVIQRYAKSSLDITIPCRDVK